MMTAVEFAAPSTATITDWRSALPSLTGARLTLRELRAEDAPVLVAMVSTEEVSRFISPPPTTIEGFERFIAWTHREHTITIKCCGRSWRPTGACNARGNTP